MPEFDKLDSYIDEAGLIKDTDFFLAQLKRVEVGAGATAESIKAGFVSIYGNNAGVKSTIDAVKQVDIATSGYGSTLNDVAASTKNFSSATIETFKSTEKLIEQRRQAENAIKSYKVDQKEDLQLLKDRIIDQSEYKKRLNESTLAIEKQKLAIKDVNAQIKTNLNAAPAGTQAAIRQENKIITKQRELTPLSDTKSIEEFNKKLDENNNLLDINSDKLSRQKINIGNYQGAANSIIDAFEKQKGKLGQLTGQYQFLGSQLDKQKNVISGLSKNVNSADYKKAVGELGKLEKQFENVGKEVKQTRTVVEGFRRVADVAAQDFNNVGAAQKALSNEAKNIGVQYGTTSTVFKEVNKVVGETSKEFNTVTKAVDASGKNAKTAGGLFQKAFGGLRTLANILPGVGISGLLLFAIEPIVDFIKYLTKANTTLFGYGEQLKLIKKINDEASVSGGKALADLQIQQRAIENTLLPMGKRLQVIKDIKEEYPDYFKGIATENLLNGQAAAAYNLAADGIIRKAKAQAAAAEIEKLQGEKLKIQLQQQLAAEEANDKIRKAKGFSQPGSQNQDREFDEFGVERERTKQQNQKIIADDFIEKDKAAQKEIDLIDKKTKVLINLTDAGAKDVIKIEKQKNEKVKKENSITALKERLDTSFEIEAIDRNRRLSLLNEIFNDENNSYDLRIKALNNYSSEYIKLNADTYNEKVQDAIKNTNDEIARLEEEKAGKTIKQQARINENIKILQQNSQQEILLIKKQGQEKELEILDKNQGSFDAITKSNNEKIKKDLAERQLKKDALESETTLIRDSLLRQYNERSILLNNLFTAGKISQKAFDSEKEKADISFQEVSLKNEIEYQRKLIELANLSPDERKRALDGLASLEKSLNDGKEKSITEITNLEKKLSDLSVDNVKKAEKEKRDEYLKTLSIIKEQADTVFNIIGSIIDASSIRQKNKLAEEKNDIEVRTAAEIAAVEASGENEEKKAARIAIINARALSQKEAIARREKQIEIDKARFDKAQTIFRLTLALAEAIATLDPFRIIAATIQLGVAIATPIPKFAKGLNYDYEGPAVVGDGGRKEVIKRKDGSIELTPDTDSLTYINKGDRIHPDANLFLQDMQHAAMRDVVRAGKAGTPVTEKQHAFDMAAAYDRKIQTELLSKIANKRENHISAKDGALVSLWKYGASTTKYIDENTNW